jgi:hypothetical protein
MTDRSGSSCVLQDDRIKEVASSNWRAYSRRLRKSMTISVFRRQEILFTWLFGNIVSQMFQPLFTGFYEIAHI